MTTYPIPAGWERILSGLVRVGDKVWAASTQRFIDVTEGTLNDLGFLDAMAVEECICVIRPRSSVG